MLDLEENKRELDELQKRFSKLEETLGNIEDLESKIKSLENKTLENGFWEDNNSANLVMREMKELKFKYNSSISIKKDIENLIETNEFLFTENDEEMSKDLAKSTVQLRKKIEELETKLLLSGKFDINNAIITLHPGARRNRITRLGWNAI